MKVFRISGRDSAAHPAALPMRRCLNESLPHKRKRRLRARRRWIPQRRLNESLPHKRKRLRICFIIERNMRASMKVFRISGRDSAAHPAALPMRRCLNESLPHKRKRPRSSRCPHIVPARLNESLPHKRKRPKVGKDRNGRVRWASMKVFRISGRDFPC